MKFFISFLFLILLSGTAAANGGSYQGAGFTLVMVSGLDNLDNSKIDPPSDARITIFVADSSNSPRTKCYELEFAGEIGDQIIFAHHSGLRGWWRVEYCDIELQKCTTSYA